MSCYPSQLKADTGELCVRVQEISPITYTYYSRPDGELNSVGRRLVVTALGRWLNVEQAGLHTANLT